MLSMLSCLVDHLYVFTWKMSIQVFCPLLIRLFWFWYWVVWAIYIFCILTLYQTHHLLIFYLMQLVVFFFLSVAFFTVQKFLSFIRSHLFIFAFVYFGWGDRSSDTTFICTEKPQKLCNSLYCDVCFILVVWNWIHISEVCLYILAIFTITLFLSLLLADSSVPMPAFMETESNKIWHNKVKFIDGVRGSSSRCEGEIEVPQR